MSAKRLSYGKPLIHGFTFYAYPLAILAQEERALDWIHSNFIQFCIRKDLFEGFPVPLNPYVYDHTAIPWLRTQRIYRKYFEGLHIDIVDFICQSIDLGWFVDVVMDEYYIPNRMKYKQEALAHETLVFGYDKETRMFDLLGFDGQMRFTETQASFEEVAEAFNMYVPTHNWNAQILLYQFNDEASYQFHPLLVANVIEDYLLSRNTSERMFMMIEPYDKCVFGLDVYAKLEEYFQLILEKQLGHDYRYLHVFWEHKKSMLARIGYMEEKGWIDPASGFSERYAHIEKEMLTVRNSSLFFMIDSKETRLDFIQKQLKSLRKQEAEILWDLVREMRACAAKGIAQSQR
jgi:hypothetical protein